jgi:hypothetical protein
MIARSARFIIVLAFTSLLSACVVVAYSDRKGWSIWPGSLVIFGVLFLFWLLGRRRR